MMSINELRKNKPFQIIINILIIIVCLLNLSSIHSLITIPASRMIDHIEGVKFCRPSDLKESLISIWQVIDHDGIEHVFFFGV